MADSKYRIEVYSTIEDHRGRVLIEKFKDWKKNIKSIQLSDNYLINVDISESQIEEVAKALSQKVTQGYCINKPYTPAEFDYAIEIGFLPGVTDNVSHTVREIIEDQFKMELDVEKSVFSSATYFFNGDFTAESIKEISEELYNPLIQRVHILSKKDYIDQNGMGQEIPLVNISEKIKADSVSLDLNDQELIDLGKSGIKNEDGSFRGPLALDLDSMQVIKNYFQNVEKRDPKDIELESIAQTWSEHCKHTIFAAEIDGNADGIYKHYIRRATKQIRKEKGKDDICLSVFTDNAGGIVFDDNYIVADKVETHNSPSALDPFGGSITGIVGVNRDEMGFGMGAKPIANRYGFCFADPSDENPLYRSKDKDSELLSPRRIMDGVIHGVNVGGNHSGIPTPQGFVYFDERYKGKPLVFVGTIGLIPREVNGKSSVEKQAQPGDAVVMVGGRVGLDGIHGATFSSEALDSGSPATAVQIGDPITQKKMSDAIVKEARDLDLYNSITDNGAGGLSCSVAEMAKECGGFVADLEKIPLKYPGLSPWQIWISESQERMTLSIPKNKVDQFIGLMKTRGVEATVIGEFNNTNRAVVKYNGEVIYDLDMDFLHDGLPQKKLKTVYNVKPEPKPEINECTDYNKTLSEMINRLNTASFEFISTQYDHEVQANSVVKPLAGPGRVNTNATVVRPVLDSPKGVVLSQGLYPSYSEIDTYKMAACSIDTSIRNAISVGGTLDSMALLDNFCWCDSNNSERLGQLKRASEACYDYAVAFQAPFVSGKDSMFNDFKGYDKDFNPVNISVPPTLLVSSIGVIDDATKTQTIDFKFAGDKIYLLGETKDELAGSEYYAYLSEENNKQVNGGEVPAVDAQKNIKLYRAFEKAMQSDLIASSISVERAGLGLALAKSSMSGLLGASVDLSKVDTDKDLRSDTILFSETQGRILVSVSPENAEAFEKCFDNLSYKLIGEVSSDSTVKITGSNGSQIVDISVDSLHESYKKRFEKF